VLPPLVLLGQLLLLDLSVSVGVPPEGIPEKFMVKFIELFAANPVKEERLNIEEETVVTDQPAGAVTDETVNPEENSKRIQFTVELLLVLFAVTIVPGDPLQMEVAVIVV
jgi:hypothetical protein